MAIVTKSKISRNLAIFLTEKFIKKSVLELNKGKYKFYAKETKILGECYLLYPNEEFWKNMNLGFQLNSFAFFKMQQGKDELEKQWRIFQFNKKLDISDKSVTFEENKVPEVFGKKEQGLLNWISN